MDYSTTHREIIEACKEGKRSAQFELYQLYSKAMYNICLRMLNNDSDAEDILQNSFVDVFSKLNSFRYDSSIGAWIKRITINNCLNFLKKRKIHFEELSDGYNYIEEKLERTQPDYNVNSIKKALVQLPDGYRVVFSLYAMEGYDHKEISSILNVTEATSKSQYSRAKQKLREILTRPITESQMY